MNFIKMIAACSLLTATAGQAASITYQTPNASSQSGLTGSLSLPKLSSALGMLTSITLGASGTTFSTVGVENFQPTPLGFAAASGAQVIIDAPTGEQLGFGAYTLHPILHLSGYDGAFDYSGTSGATLYAFDNGSDSSSLQLLGNYIGNNNFALNYQIYDLVAQGSFPNQHFTYFSEDVTSFYASVTYNYDAAISPPGGVPEPASWALLIMGFGLTGATMRRRRRAGASSPDARELMQQCLPGCDKTVI